MTDTFGDDLVAEEAQGKNLAKPSVAETEPSTVSVPAGRAPLSSGDVRLSASLPLFAIAALALPERRWHGAAKAFNRVGRLFKGANPMTDQIAQLLAPNPAYSSAQSIMVELEAGRIEAYFQILRSYRPGGWSPEVDFHGKEHLDAALAKGNGAILWVDHFVFNGLAPKQSMAEAGLAFSHLSRPEHGFSKTGYGIKWLNPIRSRIEDRFLANRIMIERGAESKSVRTAMAHLKRNKIVSITAGAWEGRKVGQAPVLGKLLPLATGAPSIAMATGAALLPVTLVRPAGGLKFELHFGEPIVTRRNGSSKEETLERIFVDYGKRLEPWVTAYPGQWRGWKYLSSPE